MASRSAKFLDWLDVELKKCGLSNARRHALSLAAAVELNRQLYRANSFTTCDDLDEFVLVRAALRAAATERKQPQAVR